jgi:hypothetical protein
MWPNITRRRHQQQVEPEPFQPWAETVSPGNQLDLMMQLLQLSESNVGIYCTFRHEHEAMALEMAANLGLSIVPDPHSLAYLITPNPGTGHRFLQSLHQVGIPASQGQFKTCVWKVVTRVTGAASKLLVIPWRAVAKCRRVQVWPGVRNATAWTIRKLMVVVSIARKVIHFVIIFLILCAFRITVRVVYTLLILAQFVCNLFFLFINVLYLIGLIAFDLLVLLVKVVY